MTSILDGDVKEDELGLSVAQQFELATDRCRRLRRTWWRAMSDKFVQDRRIGDTWAKKSSQHSPFGFGKGNLFLRVH